MVRILIPIDVSSKCQVTHLLSNRPLPLLVVDSPTEPHQCVHKDVPVNHELGLRMCQEEDVFRVMKHLSLSGGGKMAMSTFVKTFGKVHRPNGKL